MEQITREVIEEILRTYQIITMDLKEIKKALSSGRAGKKAKTTLSLLNEFFADLEGIDNAGGELECSAAEQNE
ncbi:uncharacterized protein NESG_01862 [Nematocida ausubeli]|uniref:Uncharacterized protein n=1 Tax=Nematocida ausubeli (strain ATCC PRA-371 / ERTm2) TaxID=1913371 RepID=H8ZEW3_NEMA1|nr:uncharacterized protein NESG_01862 [Nematocida ausubeli]EHY64729.1 hypothetical protein NERG_02132 [Nematocida ausubeli]KAI5134489.1 hypothetical protein NEAUS07_0834 [Nematocida ausubeli]KFG25874.1 hypothetical protein NESG_01862 [Nematocida ausubeli]